MNIYIHITPQTATDAHLVQNWANNDSCYIGYIYT